MKKRYSRKSEITKPVIKGAYDLDGKWWHEDDIRTFTGGMIQLCFGKERSKIKITERQS